MSALTAYRLVTTNLFSSFHQKAMWNDRNAHLRQAWRLLFRHMGAKCDLFEFDCFLGDRHNLPEVGSWIDGSSSTATGLDLLRPYAISEGKHPDPRHSMYWQVVGRLAPEALSIIVDSPYAARMGEVAPWFTILLRQHAVMRAYSHDWGASPIVFVTNSELAEIEGALAEISPDLQLVQTRF